MLCFFTGGMRDKGKFMMGCGIAFHCCQAGSYLFSWCRDAEIDVLVRETACK